jgi:hypothetical protein
VSDELNGGRLIAAIGGVLLLVSLFLEWYRPDLSAWDTFELADLVLGAAGIAAIAVVIRPLLTDRLGPPRDDLRSLFYLGIGVLIIIVGTLIQAPPAALDDTPQAGAWVALVGCILVIGGALLSSSRISVTVRVDRRESVTPPDGADVVPPPAGTEPAPPDSETSSIFTREQ